MVYDDAEKLYAEIRVCGEALLAEAFDILFPKSVPLSSEISLQRSKSSTNIVAFNTTFFARKDIVEIPLNGFPPQFKANIVHTSSDGKIGYALVDCPAGGSPGTLSVMSKGFPIDCLPAYGKPPSR
jgi:alpha-mannosidase